MKNKNLKRLGMVSLAAMISFSVMDNSLINISANDANVKAAVDDNGYNILGAVASVDKNGSKVTFNMESGERLRFSFLEQNVFRMYMAPAGEDFKEYPTPNNSSHTATITNKKDSDYEAEYEVDVTVDELDDKYVITTEKVRIEIAKEQTLIKVMNAKGEVVWEETAPLKYKTGSTIQTLATDKDEYFYGGGTQNGRFSHKGNIIEIVNTNNWVDKGVASPNPFYWSTDGYGVVRNTWKPGAYDFGKTDANTVTTTHNEKRFDAYYFIDDGAENILGDYYELTGKPAELPEYASYLGHLNCYNRDYWLEVAEGTSGAVKLGDKWYKESQSDNGGVKETLLGDGNMTAQQIIEDHKANDMPLGWFLPNDGYGCGYGQSDSQAGDIANLQDFSDYAIDNGVQTGLWTQSNLWPADASNPQKGERDIYKEVEAGVHSVKTDVAWVGAGYSMALNGISVAYDAIATKSGLKPNIVTLDGWAGTQRYGGIWTGDQYGGQWEYIRFHIPTYIGTGLSGQPNVGSDMDGIFGGKNTKVWTRDFQWKAFTTYMLDMDGWGSNQKSPWALGEDGTSINRAYLKLKAQLMPYTNTASHEATANGGLPMIRAMFLEEENDYTLGKATQYQYMWGDSFLVAPIYQETAVDAEGNDIRNDIYLPATSDIWTDYFTGQQYRGGQILNNFDAPIWKLPVFVKNGSIIPMYAENNNPEAVSETNADGLDRSQRIVEFFPSGSTSFDAYEDDGKTLGGAGTTTTLTSNVEGNTATLAAEKTVGSYVGMVKERSNEFIVNVQEAPTAITGTVKGKDVTFTAVTTQEDYDKATGNVYYYNENPSIFVKEYASEGSKYETTTDTTTPKLYVKSAEKVDITEYGFKVVIEGFNNTQDLGKDELNESVAFPNNIAEAEKTSTDITLGWDAVAGAKTYDVEADGIVYRNINVESFTHTGLTYLTDHVYRVRTVTHEGYSNWSAPLTIQTADDPYRNVPKDMTISFVGGTPPAAYGGKFAYMIDGDNTSEYSSAAGGAWRDQEFIIDMKKAYPMESFEYICRENMGNGAVKKFGLMYSRDGVNWTEYGDFVNDVKNSSIHPDNEDGRLFTHNFTTPFNARYLKFKVKDSTGGFLQAYEVRPFFTDGAKGQVVGDVNNSGALDDNDLTFYENYVGLKEVDADWEYAAGLGNIDNDDIIDAYDISYVGTQVGAKIETPASGVEGKIQVVPSKTDIKKGDVVTLDIYGIGLKNVNAFSVELPVDQDLFSVSNFGSSSVNTLFMRNFSKTRFHNDGTVDNYVAFTNVGKQDLINGTGSIAKMSITATANFTWDTEATRAIIVGQDLTKKDARIDSTQKPTAPETKNILKEASISDVVFTNDTSEEPIDAAQLWQQSNWKSLLLDGSLESSAEFKWYLGAATDIPAFVKLPTNMEFKFEKDEPLKKVRVFNRTSSNGRVTSIKAMAYSGETAYDLGTFASAQDIYEFVIPANATNIDRVVITPLTSLGSATGTQTGTEANRMLTLREIEFETDSKVDATSIAFNKNNPTSVNLGGMTGVSATVAPSNVSNPFYNITSSDSSIAKVIKVPTESAYYYVIQGMSAGTVTLTATSEDGSLTDTMEFTVTPGNNTTVLEQKIAEFEKLAKHLYKTESYNEVKAIVDAAKGLIDNDKVTQDAVDQATLDIVKGINALEFKGSNEDQPSSVNLIPQSGMARYDESSMSAAEKEHGGYVIDGNKDTIWHSVYGTAAAKLPQYVTIDLGEIYDLEQVDMLPRQTGVNGHITHYRIEVSSDEGANKVFTPVVEGFFKNDGSSLDDPATAKEVKFDKTEARYVRFIAIESLGGTPNSYASIAELNFYGVKTVNIDTLDNLIKAASKIENDANTSYTVASYEAFEAAYFAALDVQENASATEVEIYLARVNLDAAIKGLVELAGDYTINVINSLVEDYTVLKDNYTTAEFAEMQAALDAADALLAKEEIPYTEAMLVMNALIDAYNNLPEVDNELNALRDNLVFTMNNANAILAGDLTNVRPGKVQALVDAVEAARALYDAGSTDKEAIKTATSNIIKATNELWEIVNKTQLTNLIATAEKLTGNYTEASKAKLAEAIAHANVVAANKDATTTEVNEAIASLSDAMAKLEVIKTSKAALETQMNIAKAIVANKANYVASSVRNLEAVLAQAQAVFANENATQAEIDAVAAKLSGENMKARLKADMSALNEAVRKARSVDLSKYDVASATALKNVMANADRVLGNEESTQTEVDMATFAVESAIKGLVPITSPAGNEGTPAPAPAATPVVARPRIVAPAVPTPTPVVDAPEAEATPIAHGETVTDETSPKAKTATKGNDINPAMPLAATGIVAVALGGLFIILKKRKEQK